MLVHRTDSVLMGRTPVSEDAVPPAYRPAGAGSAAAPALQADQQHLPGTSGRSQATPLDPAERWTPDAQVADDDYMHASFVQQPEPAEVKANRKRHKHRHKNGDRDQDRHRDGERDRSKSRHREKKRKSDSSKQGEHAGAHWHERRQKRRRERSMT